MSAKLSNKAHHHIRKVVSRVGKNEQKKPFNWRMLVLFPAWVALAFFASNVIVAGILFLLDLVHLGLAGYLRPAIFQTVIAAVIYILTIGIVIAVPHYTVHSRTSLRVLGLSRLASWTDIGLAPVAFIAYTLLVATFVATLRALLPELPFDQVQDVGFQTIGSQMDNMLAFITLVVLAPVAEETLFRGYLYGKLKGYVPAVWAALATSLLFAVAHFQFNVGVDVFVLSLVLCGLRSLTGSIWAGILVHMLKNLIAYYLIFISPLIGG